VTPIQVLVVDDEPYTRRVLQISLEKIGGFSVDAVEGGEEALALVQRRPPDVILLDVMMPGVDGPTTLGRLRAGGGPASAIPVIFVTARALPHEVERLSALGAYAVVLKPFEPVSLSGLIRAALASSSLAI